MNDSPGINNFGPREWGDNGWYMSSNPEMNDFGRGEQGESKALFAAKARTYIEYVSVSLLKATRLSPRSRRPK